MNKIAILIFLLLALVETKQPRDCIASNSKVDSLFNNTIKNESIRKYYYHVYQAEDYIINENFIEASNSYFNAFQLLKYPFRNDLYNALNCELYCENPNLERVKQLVISLRQKNENLLYYTKNNQYLEIFSNKDILKILDTTTIIKDNLFMAKVDSIFFIDQNIREQSFSHDTIKQIDSLNYSYLINLIEAKGFFSEELFGGLQDYIKIYTMILHNSDNYDIFPILFSSVKDGSFDARLLAGILDDIDYKYKNKNSINENLNGFQIHNDVYYYVYPNENSFEEVNKLRQSIYLESIDNRIKKFKWSFSNQGNRISFINQITRMYFPSEQLNDLLLKHINNSNNNFDLFFTNDSIKQELINMAINSIKE
jgi:hypothetical protein